MTIEQYLCDFEKECDCILTVHDLRSVFVDADGKSLLAVERSSHRKRICICASTDREYCIYRCMNQVNRRAQQRHERSYFKHCKTGVIEIVAPLFQNQVHVATFFAGIWGSKRNSGKPGLSPVDSAKAHRLRRLLPLFAAGIMEFCTQNRFRGSREFNRKSEISNFIMANACSPIILNALAKNLNLSSSRTCHMVKEYFGKSLNVLIAEERLERARQLLITTDYRMNEIAELTGMGSAEHFSRTFRRYCKMSPGEFRSRYRLVWD